MNKVLSLMPLKEESDRSVSLENDINFKFFIIKKNNTSLLVNLVQVVINRKIISMCTLTYIMKLL